MPKSLLFDIHFGGPDLSPGRLRDLLAERIRAVPAGGSIDWVTYYFRDRGLASELLRAHRRGVKVTVTIDRYPRTPIANDNVIATLTAPDKLGKRFRTVSFPGLPTPSGKRWKPHLHEKLYCFSHPKPVAYIGSFNPSGDDPEKESDIIREIGDHNRSHNVLVGLYDPELVTGLVNNAKWLYRSENHVYHRFSPFANRIVKGVDTEIYFWPRLRPHPVIQFLKRIGDGAHIRIAASHIKGRSIVKAIIRLAQKGAKIEVLADSTFRRVPKITEQMLKDADVSFRRINHTEGVLMHNKFILVEKNKRRWAVFGSFNWTTRSYWLNHEIGAITTNLQLFDAFAERWEALNTQKS